MTTTDLFEQRVKECRRLAAAARKASDKVFWLGLVERWQALEIRQRYLRQGTQAAHLQEHRSGRGSQAAGG